MQQTWQALTRGLAGSGSAHGYHFSIVVCKQCARTPFRLLSPFPFPISPPVSALLLPSLLPSPCCRPATLPAESLSLCSFHLLPASCLPTHACHFPRPRPRSLSHPIPVPVQIPVGFLPAFLPTSSLKLLAHGSRFCYASTSTSSKFLLPLDIFSACTPPHPPPFPVRAAFIARLSSLLPCPPVSIASHSPPPPIHTSLLFCPPLLSAPHPLNYPYSLPLSTVCPPLGSSWCSSRSSASPIFLLP